MTDGSAQQSALRRALGEAREAHAYADKLENVWLSGDAIESDAGKMGGDRLREYAAMVRADGNSRAFIVAGELLCAVLERLDALVESVPTDDEPEPLPCGRQSPTCPQPEICLRCLPADRERLAERDVRP
jgi:hypothetical protein